MRPRAHVAADERAVQHARQHDVVDVATVTGEQARVLASPDRLADEPAGALELVMPDPGDAYRRPARTAAMMPW